MGNAIAVATEAFGETLKQLERKHGSPKLGKDPAALGRRAALLIMAESVWSEHLGPLLETDEVMSLLGVATRQAVSDLARRGRILALPGSGGRRLYPAFQFSPGGRPYPAMAAILQIFSGVVETPYTIASWFVSPQGLLDDETPTAWLRAKKDSSRLLAAAERSAGELNL